MQRPSNIGFATWPGERARCLLPLSAEAVPACDMAESCMMAANLKAWESRGDVCGQETSCSGQARMPSALVYPGQVRDVGLRV